ncbi:phosphate ABC transporter substrate-binding protein [Iodidimonas gelatinilytica]|uniref:Phosphate-binding protein n=1 Tax=Iodidimonas gelatinilytica TaxID=1236966 RepID=A0A5A7MVK7_9PROT|nr:PstS family phosphate ABC transporter substrate-binding protein [Iodidimonas gelatinilytica]GEQ97928.1 phosphate ABC transporter substrate-binding protein [Iodidimonas gelatinilytica]GEQ99951.1 phosphate ABC transporter substrate-binding protein [Iodidimonas gelatinilytica]
MKYGAIALGAAVLATMSGGASAQDLVKVDGSSTVFPITEAMAEEFQIEYRGKYRVTVGVSGSGGGFKKFCRGEVDVTNASRPIRPSEVEQCRENGIEFMELPVALDALAVVINPKNDWVDYLTVDELKKMWEPDAQRKINNWSQIREGFPDKSLDLFGAGADSGTYDYFTQAIVGKEHASRGDYTASEDDNVLVMGVANTLGGLGFFGFAYLSENTDKLKPVPIKYKDADPVLPSIETAKNSTYQPLSRPLFVYVSKAAADNREVVQNFVDYFLDPELAAELVSEVGYVPLPAEAYDLARKAFDDRVTGTVFKNGSQIGISIEDLLQSERSR